MGRDRKGRLVALPVQERRAIRDREQRETEARDEERRRNCCMAGIARERRRGEPQRDRSTASGSTECAECRGEQARREHRDGEHDQGRHEQQERARAAAAGELLRVDRAARPPDEDDGDRADGGSVQSGEPGAAQVHGRRAHRCVEEQAGGRGDRGRCEEAALREQCMSDHVAGRGTGARRNECGDGTAEHPPDDRAGDCERAATRSVCAARPASDARRTTSAGGVRR